MVIKKISSVEKPTHVQVASEQSRTGRCSKLVVTVKYMQVKTRGNTTPQNVDSYRVRVVRVGLVIFLVFPKWVF